MALLQITLTLNVVSDREIHFPLIASYWLSKQWQLPLEKMLKLKELNWERKRPSSFNTQIGIVTSKCTLLNYLLLVGKLFLWECRRNKVLPNIYGFQTKVGIKYETEKFICTKNNKLHQFHRKWTIITL